MSKEYKIHNWKSMFLAHVELIKDPEVKIKLLTKHIISMERQNKTLRARLAGKKGALNIEPDDYLTVHRSHERFYRSNKWMKLRFHFLANHPSKKCALCGDDKEIHVDHIVPRSIEPSLALDPDNLQILCKQCNLGKGTETFKASVILRKKV